MHGAIEFGNRLLTFVLVVVVALTWITALRLRDPARADVRGGRRRDVRWLAGGLLLGIPAQIVIGGISVLTHLNPWVVGLHFVVSMALVGLAVGLVRVSLGGPPASGSTRGAGASSSPAWPSPGWSSPSGSARSSPAAARTPATWTRSATASTAALVAHLHAAAVWVTIAFTLALLLVRRSRPVVLLLAVEVLQAVLGSRSTTWASRCRSSRCTCWARRSRSPRRRTCCSPSAGAPVRLTAGPSPLASEAWATRSGGSAPGVEVWRSTGRAGPTRVLPDGCLDLLFDGRRLLVAGPGHRRPGAR